MEEKKERQKMVRVCVSVRKSVCVYDRENEREGGREGERINECLKNNEKRNTKKPLSPANSE